MLCYNELKNLICIKNLKFVWQLSKKKEFYLILSIKCMELDQKPPGVKISKFWHKERLLAEQKFRLTRATALDQRIFFHSNHVF
jgi:hypothetical protein